MRRFALHQMRMGVHVHVFLEFAFLAELVGDLLDHVTVLGVQGDDRARVRRHLHRAEDRQVVDHHRAGVGHQEFEAGHPLSGQRTQLFQVLRRREVRRHQVESVVDHSLGFGLATPTLNRLKRRHPLPLLSCEIDDRGRAAKGGRHRARLPTVGGHGVEGRLAQMRVHVDPAWNHVLALRGHSRVRVDLKLRADLHDHAVVQIDIGDKLFARRRDDPARNQD